MVQSVIGGVGGNTGSGGALLMEPLTVTIDMKCGEKRWNASVVFKPEDMYEERVIERMHLFSMSAARALIKSDLIKLTDETKELIEEDRKAEQLEKAV